MPFRIFRISDVSPALILIASIAAAPACSPTESAAPSVVATDDTGTDDSASTTKKKKTPAKKTDAGAAVTDASVAEDTGSDAARPPIDCDQSPHAIGTTERTVLGGTFHTYVPATYSKTKPVPVVVALHGAGDQAISYLKYEWQANADALGWIVVAPEGSLIVSTGKGWAAIDESRIMGALQVSRACYATLTKKTIIQGFSTGASMALFVALKHPNDFSGVALSSGSLDQAEKTFNGGAALLPAARALPVSIFHGKTDPVVLFTAAQATQSSLEKNGHTVTFHSFTGAHKTTPADALIEANDLASASAP